MTKRVDLEAIEARALRAVAYDNGEIGMRRLLVDHTEAKADLAALCAEVRALRSVATAARAYRDADETAQLLAGRALDAALAKLDTERTGGGR